MTGGAQLRGTDRKDTNMTKTITAGITRITHSGFGAAGLQARTLRPEPFAWDGSPVTIHPWATGSVPGADIKIDGDQAGRIIPFDGRFEVQLDDVDRFDADDLGAMSMNAAMAAAKDRIHAVLAAEAADETSPAADLDTKLAAGCTAYCDNCQEQVTIALGAECPECEICLNPGCGEFPPYCVCGDGDPEHAPNAIVIPESAVPVTVDEPKPTTQTAETTEVADPKWQQTCERYLRYVVMLRGAGGTLSDADHMFLIEAAERYGIVIREVVTHLAKSADATERKIAATMLDYGIYA